MKIARKLLSTPTTQCLLDFVNISGLDSKSARQAAPFTTKIAAVVGPEMYILHLIVALGPITAHLTHTGSPIKVKSTLTSSKAGFDPLQHMKQAKPNEMDFSRVLIS